MKREEIIAAELRRRHDEVLKMTSGMDSLRASYYDGCEDTLRQIIDFIEEMPTDPTSITLTLPTYAPGDPKAGEAVEQGDTVYPMDPTSNEIVWMDSAVVSMFSMKGGTTVIHYAYDSVPEYGTFDDGTAYFSTAAARDAAMKAAEEAARDEAE